MINGAGKKKKNKFLFIILDFSLFFCEALGDFNTFGLKQSKLKHLKGDK